MDIFWFMIREALPPLILLAVLIFGVIYAAHVLRGIIKRRQVIDEFKGRKLEAALDFEYNRFYNALRNRPKQLQAPINAEPVFESWKDEE